MTPHADDLQQALQELELAAAEAVEDGLEVPSKTAFKNAKRLLEAMYRISPRRFAVYPDYDGYLTIDARGRSNNIAVVMCGSDGGVLCIANIDGESRRVRYAAAGGLPDDFLRRALLDLGPEAAPVSGGGCGVA